MKRFISEQRINAFDFLFDLSRAGQLTPDAGQCAIDKRNGGTQQSILSVFVKWC
ncbi:MAG: hypothetical protein H6R25_3810 [Proteobacteria bacterium]|nr:hypothetical protein [Pseudomonadota bacterium]